MKMTPHIKISGGGTRQDDTSKPKRRIKRRIKKLSQDDDGTRRVGKPKRRIKKLRRAEKGSS